MSRIVAIDVREALSEQKTGKGWYAFELVKAALPLLLERFETIKLVYGRVQATTTQLKEGLSHEQQQRVISVSFSDGPLWHLHVARWLKRQPEYRYLSPTSAVVPAFLPKQSVYVVHDLIAFKHRREAMKHDKKAWLLERLFGPRAMRNSKQLIAVSQGTANALQAKFKRAPDGIVTPGVHEVTQTYERPQERPYIVSVGSLVPRKNHVALVRAFKRVAVETDGWDLVLIGQRLWGFHDVKNDIEKDGVFKRVNETTWVTKDRSSTIRQLPDLTAQERDQWVQHADLSVYPSVYEGFGMPVIEAMQQGVPVICSDHVSLNDAAGDAAVRVDTTRVDVLAQVMQEMLIQNDRRQLYIKRGKGHAAQFRWERSAQQLIDLLVASYA